MDPISIGASQLQLSIRSNSEGKFRNDTSEKQEDAFKEVITSCRSLNKYETNTLKTAIPQISAAIAAASFHVYVGIALSYSSILVPQIESPDSDIPQTTKTLTSLCASIVVLMVPVGSLIAGYLMDIIGRTNTIKVAVFPAVLGFIFVALASDVYYILAGRILTGLACAIGTSPAYVFITEIARPDLRGSLISSAPTIASLGMCLAYIAGVLFDWRTTAWLSIIFAVIPILLVQFAVVESPVYLVSKGRIEDAAKSLKYLYKKYPQPDQNESLADMHLRALICDNEKRIAEKIKVSSMTDVKSHKTQSKWANFKKPTGYKPLIILFFLFFIQQFSGIYITLFYSVTFLQDVGADGIDPFVSSIFLGVVRFLMSLMNAWLLRRFKRRFLIMVSTFFMASFMFISGSVTIWIEEGAKELKVVPVICLLGFVCSSMIGLLSIPWTLTAEMFPTSIRSAGHSISFSIANILMFVAVQAYRPLLYILGGPHAVQWFFALFSIIGFFFALCVLPETHGKTLAEIEMHFEKKSPAKNRVNASDIYSVSANSKEVEQMLKMKENA
ncbi:hypothetical protein PVAND_005080 [Polypedilum vanderplanki]|uniref:Major facilitator superfamily (MFS) profile domain-containing protein n=1 Tax=Polypedilum vanderplanki TaxID=319348 RepID=A0A9J6BZI0_POLVA|nr:hypothetical protein PVAND_005080 [Polypedilum vanderplanki]